MVPSAATVANRRHAVAVVFRLVGVLSLLAAPVPMISWLIEGTIDQDLWLLSYYGGRIAGGLALLGSYLVLWFGARRIARRVVPMGTSACPECGYELRDASGERCPECGVHVGADFASPGHLDVRAEGETAPSTWIPVLCIRLFALAVAIWSVGSNLTWVLYTLSNGVGSFTSDWYVMIDFIALMATLLFGLGAAIALWFGAGRLARRIVAVGPMGDANGAHGV